MWLLKGKFELATDEYDTEGEKPKAQSGKLKGKFYPREADGNYRFIADEDAVGVDAMQKKKVRPFKEALADIEKDL